MIADQDQLSQAFQAARECESALRQAVRTDLSRMEGPLWISVVPKDLQSKWESIRQMEENSGIPIRGQDLLEYATLDEVAALINKYPAVFEPRFGSHDSFQVVVNAFRIMRNRLMHGTFFSPDDATELQHLAGELTAKCRSEVKWAAPSEKLVRPVETPLGATPLSEGQLRLLKVVTKATEQMSGLLTGERTAILDYIRSNLAESSFETLAIIRRKFSAIPGTERLFEKALQDLAPSKPSIPQVSWSVSKWLNWATRNYMPYRRWVIRNKVQDTELEAMSLCFSDWLYGIYPELLIGNQDSLVISTYKWIKQQLDNQVRVLWLVADNLAGLWLTEFVGALTDAGIQIRDNSTRRMLAMLPSNTLFSRRSMLAGRLPKEAYQLAEEHACRQLWGEQGFPDVAYCVTAPEVEHALEGDSRLIIFLSDRLDSLSHTHDHPGFDHQEEMHNFMASLSAKLSGLLRKMRSIGPSVLVISTDHGSVWPGPGSETVTVPPSAVPDEDLETLHRSAMIRDSAGLNSVDWYLLDEKTFALPSTYGVPRGQKFIGARPRAYTHGGLSPEETVVVFLVADIGEREPLELILSQATPAIRLGRPCPLSIMVRNPFDFLIEDLEISIPALAVRFEPFEVPARSEAQSQLKNVIVPINADVREDSVYFEVDCQCQLLGKPSYLPGRLKINIKRLYRSTIDDLGDMLSD